MRTASELLAKGEVHEEKGDYLKAGRFYQKALALKEREVGKQHADLVPYIYNLGMVQCALENNGEAEWTLTRLLSLLTKEFGEDHEEIKEVRILLADLKSVEQDQAPPLAVNA